MTVFRTIVWYNLVSIECVVQMNFSIKFTFKHFTIYLYHRLCGDIVVISRVDFETAGSRVTSPESYDACPFRPTVATINLTIVKGRLIHATLLSIRYSLSRKRIDFYDFHLDYSVCESNYETHTFHSLWFVNFCNIVDV